MDRAKITRALRRMRSDWDERARSDAKHFVATGKHHWTDEEFFASGQVCFDRYIRTDLDAICQGRDPASMTVLEIGCGAGRVTRALARYFGRVYAVDISAEMVKRTRLATNGFFNTFVYRNNGKDLDVLRKSWRNRAGIALGTHIDFAFSYIVFQHIPDRAIIENYLREVNRLLRPGGLFKCQVQGAGAVEAVEGDTWVGVPFSEADAREMAGRCGFEMRHHLGAGDQEFWLWLFKHRDL